MEIAPLAYVILGMPGSGKETVQKLLTKRIIEKHKKEVFISDTGSLFRSALKDEPTSIIKYNAFNKKRVGEINDSGKLQCSALATGKWVSHFLCHYTGEPYIIFDGSPRRKEEAVILEQFLIEYCNAHIRYIYIAVAEEKVIERMTERNKTHPRPETSSLERIRIRIYDYLEKNHPTIEHIMRVAPQDYIVIENNSTLDDLTLQIEKKIPL